jgi:hypothetical protein
MHKYISVLNISKQFKVTFIIHGLIFITNI